MKLVGGQGLAVLSGLSAECLLSGYESEGMNMNNQSDHDTYIIPPNFVDTGTFFGGMI